MKLAITCQGSTLDDAVDSRLGRCPWLLFVDTSDWSCDALANPYAEEPSGVGGRVVSLLAQRGAEAVLTGTVGPQARQALDAAGLRAVENCAGPARQAAQRFLEQSTSPAAEMSPPDTSPARSPAGTGRGRGLGPCGGGGRRRRQRRRQGGLGRGGRA
ncbi:MAG: NifB/NifX family molybdenum-iron cluster-binding protein [Phycisphaeraceae bacterium]